MTGRQLSLPGRLFLKIFLALWLAIGSIVYSVDHVVNALFQAELAKSPELSIGYRAELATMLVAANLQHGGLADTRQLFLEWSGRRPLPVLVVDEETGADILGRSVPPFALVQAQQLLEGVGPSNAVQRVNDKDGRAHVLFVPLALLPASPPRQHVYKTPDSSRIELVAMTLASFLFAFGLAWYLFRPIRHLHEASQRFAGGELQTRVAPLLGRRSDELADLANDFDEMAERLQATIDGKTRLLHDVSHELRSPLTRLQVALEIARRSPEKTGRMLDRIEHEVGRLDRLLGETLALSRLESDPDSLGGDCVNLTELLEDVIADARFEATQQGKSIVLKADDDVIVAGRPELLHSAFENVVRNGVLHTPAGATVTIKLYKSPPVQRDGEQAWATLRVCDSGSGVPSDELETIFEPFYRGRGASKTGGHGLGLSIVRRAIEAHGGTVSAGEAPAGGLCVIFRLPVLQIDCPACIREENTADAEG
ncbi:MAG: ATP-binding protein [Rhodocyclaceae bacterium]|nr:ATP-binding protein [Rhodocyclaceae bacterium]MDZ4215529.1 ATP-binding protein [Rhodocyclaceae bacterium]